MWSGMTIIGYLKYGAVISNAVGGLDLAPSPSTSRVYTDIYLSLVSTLSDRRYLLHPEL
jgi:hypothetical protein